MAEVSVLFVRPEDAPGATAPEQPEYFGDLNIDQIVATVTAGRDGYDLAPFFAIPLHDVDAVAYRHEVFADLAKPPVDKAVRDFAAGMKQMREYLEQAGKRFYRRQQQSWFLYAVRRYCAAVIAADRDMAGLELESRGLAAFRDYLAGYAGSAVLTVLHSQVAELLRRLDEVHYGIQIRGSRVTVTTYDGEADYSAQIADTFAKFRRGAVGSHLARFFESADMNHVEDQILEQVAKLYPELFAAVDAFCDRHRDYVDDTLGRFDLEVQFYLAYAEHMHHLAAAAGLSFCYPQLSATAKQERVTDTFDLALAEVLVGDKNPVVCNDFHLDGDERMIVVTGPNQGGKTTFARMFGQLHHLAALGVPVPGSDAELFLPDAIFTHFERREDLSNLRGKLADDLVRIRRVLEQATPASVVILNEAFTSTTLADALFLGEQILHRLIEADVLGVYVTFVDELASLADQVVSMAATVVPDNPAIRTFTIVRRPAEGLAYAMAIADKYGLTYRRLKERLG